MDFKILGGRGRKFLESCISDWPMKSKTRPIKWWQTLSRDRNNIRLLRKKYNVYIFRNKSHPWWMTTMTCHMTSMKIIVIQFGRKITPHFGVSISSITFLIISVYITSNTKIYCLINSYQVLLKRRRKNKKAEC